MTNTLNPVLSSNLTVEQPTQPIDVGGALSGLVNMFAGAYAESQKTEKPSADQLKQQALSPFFSRVQELKEMDLTPTQYQNELSKLTRQQLTATPQYRTDIVGGVKDVYGVDPSVDPQTQIIGTLDRLANTPQGEQALLLSITRDETGAIDYEATAAERDRRLVGLLNTEAEIARMADQTARLEGDTNRLNAYTTNQLETTLLPGWTARTQETTTKLIEESLRAGGAVDQAEALGTLKNTRENLINMYRQEALAAGLSMTVVNEGLANAVAPLDGLISGLEGSAEGYSTVLTAFQKSLELGALEQLTDTFGSVAAFPEFREEIASIIAMQAWNSESFKGALEVWEKQSDNGLTTAFDLWSDFRTPEESASAEDILSPEAMDSIKTGVEDGSIDPVKFMRTSIDTIGSADISTTKGLDTITREIGNLAAISQSMDSPFALDTLQKMFGGAALRNLTTALDSNTEGSYELRSAMAYLFGSQITRMGIRVENLGYRVGWDENGVAYLSDSGGGRIPSIVNPSGPLKDAQNYIKSLNLIGSVLNRTEKLKEPVFKGLGITPGGSPADIEEFLGNGGDAEVKGGEGDDVISSKGGGDLKALAADAAARHGVPVDLFFGLIGQESSWNPNAESPAKAWGLTQLMPKTAEELGVDPRNIAENVDGGARYIKQMLNKYGDTKTALMAYNWGPGNMDSWLKTGKGIHGQDMPKETIEYPAKVLNRGGPEYKDYAYVDKTYTPASLPSNIVVNPDMAPLYNSLEGASSLTKPYALDHMNYVLNGPFQTLQELFGKPITINDAIAKAGTSREGSTPGSQHFHGNALDLSTAGMSDEEKLNLFQAALKAGFTGFGFGNGILHVDIGPTRSWAYGNDSYGGVPIAELQNMVASGAGPRLRVATLPEGNDRDVGEWKPEMDLGEGTPSSFTAITDQAPASSPVPPERPIEDGSAREARGKPTASEKATHELSERTLAMLKSKGIDASNIMKFSDEEEYQKAVEEGKVPKGSLVAVGQEVFERGS